MGYLDFSNVFILKEYFTMAFPWLGQDTFDDGTKGAFNSESDASSILDFPDYKELARWGLSPWQGSHAMRCKLTGGVASTITENDYFDTAANATIHIWFPILIGTDVTVTATETLTLFQLIATATEEVTFGIRNNAGVYEFFCGETGATRTLPFTRSNKQWYQIEITAKIDNAGSDDGTIDFYVDGRQVGAQITALDQGAITSAVLGVIAGGAAFSGTILFGGMIADDARIYPRTRFPGETVWVTRDINAFVGPCTLDAASVTGTGTDAVMALYDTDVFSSTGVDFSREPKVYIRNVTASDQSPGINTPVQFHKGVYAVLTGTAPQGWLSLRDCGNAVVQSHDNYVAKGRKS
jgi:hypothetical protein